MISSILDKYQVGIELEPPDSKLYIATVDKWTDYVEKGWYGFSIEKAPANWVKAIDEVLSYIKDNTYKFSIEQIKTKFGWVRFEVSYRAKTMELYTEIMLGIQELEERMFSSKLNG